MKSGYKIDDTVLSADEFGVPQRRHRHSLVAVRNSDYEFDVKELVETLRIGQITVRQAIADLLDVEPSGPFDTAAVLSPEMVRRFAVSIAYLSTMLSIYRIGIYQSKSMICKL